MAEPPSPGLMAYVKAAPADAEFVGTCERRAAELVARRIGLSVVVPLDVRELAVWEVAADLFHRRSTRLGVSGFADNDLNPIRITRDPMDAAEPILRPYLPAGFA